MAKKKVNSKKEANEEIIIDYNEIKLDEAETKTDTKLEDNEDFTTIEKIDEEKISDDLEKFKEEIFKKEKEENKSVEKTKHRKLSDLFGFIWNGQEYDY